MTNFKEAARELQARILRQAADHSRMTNMEIARTACISKSTITEAMRGVYGLRLETLTRIVEACGLKLDVRLEFPPTLPPPLDEQSKDIYK